MRKLLALMGLCSVVYTEDYDGDVRLRIAHHTPFDRYCVKGICSWRVGYLRADGRIMAGSYMRRWLPYRLTPEMRAWLKKCESLEQANGRERRTGKAE